MTVTFEQLQEAARKLVEASQARALAEDTVEAFVRMVEEWVGGQPDWLKNSYIGYFAPGGGKMVKRAELPQILRSDPDFLSRFIRFLAGR
jgi:hypothetical protein